MQLSGLASKILTATPGLAAGLFAGRVLSELWAKWNGSTAWWLAILIMLLCILGGVWSFSHFSVRQSWPALLLLAYVFYPEMNLLTAGLVALFALLTGWQVNRINQLGPEIIKVLFPLLLLLCCSILYMRTLAPDILPADSGEFQLVATNLGVAHPPGFPLYTMLAHLITHLPFGPTPAYRVNLFSALTGILTLAVVYISVFKLTKQFMPATASVLVLATATTFWAQATTANIRSLTALFSALIFLTLIIFYEELKKESPNYVDRSLTLFALVFGLGVSHHASLVFLGLVAVFFILIVDSSLLLMPARWWRPILAFLIGLLPLLYLPLRANEVVRGASPSLATVPGFLEHVLATGFRGDLFVYLQPSLLFERLRIMQNVLTFQFSAGLLMVLLLALIMLVWQDWRLAFLFGGSAFLFTLITATYRAPQTVEYMLPAYVALDLILGAGLGNTNGRPLPGQNPIRVSIQYVLTALVIVMALSQLLNRFESYSYLNKESLYRDYANSILLQAPDNALLLANWHWVSPLWYLQDVEGVRPDVDIRYVFPEGEPYAQTWARLVNEGLNSSRPVITTNFDRDAFAILPVPEPLGEAFLFRQDPRMDLPDGFRNLDLNLGEAVDIIGFDVNLQEISLVDEVILTLAWEPLRELDPATHIFAHLIAPDGSLAGQQDLPVRAREEGITLTQFHLTPFAGTRPGQYEIFVGAYAQEPLPAPDDAPRTALAMIKINSSKFVPATKNPLQRQLLDGSGRRLVGYDQDDTLSDRSRLYLHWQSADGYTNEVFDNTVPVLPAFAGPWGIVSNRWRFLNAEDAANYVPLGQGITWTGYSKSPPYVGPGQELIIRHSFLSTLPVLSDQVVSTRLIGFEEDGFHWAWWDLDDTIPAMGAIPTLKWIAGSRVTSPHFVTIDESAVSSQDIGGALTLYDAFTGRVLPILDERLVDEFGWIPLG